MRQRQKNVASALHGGGGLGPANFSEAAPFVFCPTFGDGDELGNVYGPEAILKTRAHVGSSERVRRVLRRAMAGLPISGRLYTRSAMSVLISCLVSPQPSAFSAVRCRPVTVSTRRPHIPWETQSDQIATRIDCLRGSMTSFRTLRMS